MKNNPVFPEPDCHHYSPSVDGKSLFSGRMRFHQSWYRRTILGLDPGPNPSARGAIYGNMLPLKDGLQGKNFLTDEIFNLVQRRFLVKKTVQKSSYRYHNMLGSQAMCFNLFGPLIIGKKATRLIQLLPGFPQDAKVTKIIFEYAPLKEKHLNDKTSHDAFIEYCYPDGKMGFIGVETKLSEPFSQKEVQFTDRYARWIKRGEWWWKPGAEQDFSSKSFNQLWRNHLLIYAMLNQETPEYSEGYCAVVYPLGDTDCEDAIKQYKNLLIPSGEKTLLVWPLQTIAELWGEVLANDASYSQWFDDFQTRYLRLEKSHDAWLKFQGV